MRKLLFLLCIPIWVFSQHKVSGIIKDSEGFVVPFTTISATSDKEFGAISDEEGNFELNVPNGNYSFVFDAIGYNIKKLQKTINQNTTLNIVLDVEQQLKDVVAESTKPIYRFELDKKVYDVSQDLSSRGSSLSEVLENVPSVSVDVDGTINLRGNSNVKFLIDGKPSSMLGLSNSADVLRTIPASSIERIEVITNPSSRYEAEGTAGILNIVMKKGAAQGFNGNVETHIGYQTNIGGSANLNWQKENWGFFINPSVNYSEPQGENTVDLQTFNPDGSLLSYTNQTAERTRKPFTYGLNTGVNFDLSKKDLLSANVGYRKSDMNNTNDIQYHDFDGNYNLISNSSRFENEDENEYSVEGNVNYEHRFNENGKKLSVGTSIQKSEEVENALIQENSVLEDRSFNTEDQNRLVFTIDYVNPFKKGANFELGYQGKLTQNNNDFQVQSLDSSNQWQTNTDFTDQIEYNENIQAFYSQYGNTYNKFSYQVGLRLESSIISVESIINNQTIDKDYTNLFPSAFLNYNFNENNQVQINYSRRINRPRGRFLSPFFTFADERNTFRGNPDLNPSYTHSLELGYIWKKDKLSIYPQIFYKNTQDEIDVFVELQDVQVGTETLNVFVAQPYNVGVKDNFGIEIGGQYSIGKWWKMYGEFSVFSFTQRGNSDFESLNSDGVSYRGRFSSTFKLPAQIDMQLQSFFRGRENNGQNVRKAMFGANLAFSKDLFNDKATLTLNVRDVFNSRKRQIQTTGDDYLRDLQLQFRQRQINLTFSYRFNQKKKKERENNNDGGGDEGIGF